MRTRNRIALVAAAGVFVAAVPAAAKPPHPTHPSHPAPAAHPSHPAPPATSSNPAPPARPTHPAHPTHPSTSHKCMPHNEAYIASGTLVSWSATKTATGTYSGTVTVHVTAANHHASSGKASDVTFTLSNTKVIFGAGANPPSAGDAVKVIGRISALGKKCSQTGSKPTVTARMLVVHAAKKQASAQGAGSTR